MNIQRRSLSLAFGLVLAAGIAAVASYAELPRTASTEGAKLYFISPKNGETLSGSVVVRFGLTGMGVAPAGVANPGTGHHHLIVDAPLPPLNLPIPKDANHLHFGSGQTETVLELAPGEHTLQLVLADTNHVPHDPPVVSEQIRITVK
ncbi:MAG TPA: DUF4399 domain-containing protein [Myxococcota bacterium]